MKPETLKLNRLREIGLVVVSLLVIVPIAAMIYQRSKVDHLVIGAGSPWNWCEIAGRR